jgi:NADPH:quinone reductase-like Zn-dependent oxidoreductase
LWSRKRCAAEELMDVRAIVHERYGDPREVLSLASLPMSPDPGQGEVLIRVGVRPVHPGDLQGVSGPGGGETGGPRSPGLEGMGTVVSIGTGVTGLEPGIRVAFFPAPGA